MFLKNVLPIKTINRQTLCMKMSMFTCIIKLLYIYVNNYIIVSYLLLFENKNCLKKNLQFSKLKLKINLNQPLSFGKNHLFPT